ncbi:MAG: hypothetical protein J4O09_08675 [Chloroflexi bacterium]|nr:hypothetical protein [Chloroflexota bacterium]
MASDRIQRQIDWLLDEAEDAFDQGAEHATARSSRALSTSKSLFTR